MARNSVIKVSLVGDATALQRTFADTATGADRWAGRMSRAGTAMTAGLTVPIVAGAGLAIRAASEEAQQMEVLAGVIRERIPGATDAMVASNEEWVSGLQSNIAVADGEIRAMEQSFISAGASVEEAQRLTASAYDVAAATGKEATTIGAAYVKGINGQVSGLSKLGIETKDANGEAKSFNEILGELEDTMGGTAANAADTAAGRAENLKLQMADLTETLGAQLLPIFEKVVGWLSQIVGWFNNLSPAGQQILVTILGIVAAIGPMLIIGAKLVTAIKDIKLAMAAMNLTMSLNPIMLVVAAIAALIAIGILVVQNWDKISAFLLKVWANIKAAAKSVWEWIKTTIKAVADFLVQLFLNWTLPGLLMKHWETIKKGVQKVKEWIVTTWESIVSFFKTLPSKISSAVSGMWDGIKDAFRSAINWIIDKWNGLRIQIGGQRVNLPFGMGFNIPTITLNTPNIPRFHSGGIFRAPVAGGEGLALLRDGERVLPAGARGQQTAVNVYVTVNAGMGTDPFELGRRIVEVLQRYEKVNGAIPISIRAS